MNTYFVTCVAVAAASTFTTANAQFSASSPSPAKASVATVGATGGFLVGTDDCATPHRSAGTGPQAGVAFTTGTTGTDGQNELICYFFGTTGIDNDVWFDWMSNAAGNAALTTCNGTTVDTKIAVWPGNTGCPTDGTSIACNDDACGLQTTVQWPATAGTSYTFQVGTFPGVGGGSGTFDITVTLPPPCGEYDDGTSENALGLVAGGETGWLQGQDCMLRIDDVQAAYGMPGGTNPANGTASRIAVYEDIDCDLDPSTGPPVLLWSAATTTMNVGTDILNSNPTGGVVIGSRCSWVMATASQPTGVFPAPMDTTIPTPNAWIVGQTPSGATMDIVTLSNNNVPPLATGAIGFPTAWLLRAVGVESPDGPTYPTQCFGDSGCPCNNDSTAGGGCTNSTGAGGVISGTGIASLSNDGLVLNASSVPNTPGLFFQGSIRLTPPMPFGDGLLCCGQNLVRIGTYLPTNNGTDTANGNLTGGFGPPISTLPNQNISAGDSLCYQWWHRENNGPCGTKFNTTNAVKVTWTP